MYDKEKRGEYWGLQYEVTEGHESGNRVVGGLIKTKDA